MKNREQRRKAAQARALGMHELYKTGLTISEVGEQNGITKQRVSQLFHQFDLPLRPKEKSIDLADVHQRYQAGTNLETLAAEVTLSKTHLYHRLRQNGYAMRSSGRQTQWTRERVAALHTQYETGLTQAQVAEDHQVSQTFVSQLFRKYGFPTHTSGKRSSRASLN